MPWILCILNPETKSNKTYFSLYNNVPEKNNDILSNSQLSNETFIKKLNNVKDRNWLEHNFYARYIFYIILSI